MEIRGQKFIERQKANIDRRTELVSYQYPLCWKYLSLVRRINAFLKDSHFLIDLDDAEYKYTAVMHDENKKTLYGILENANREMEKMEQMPGMEEYRKKRKEKQKKWQEKREQDNNNKNKGNGGEKVEAPKTLAELDQMRTDQMRQQVKTKEKPKKEKEDSGFVA
jgi:hypothetical protein